VNYFQIVKVVYVSIPYLLVKDVLHDMVRVTVIATLVIAINDTATCSLGKMWTAGIICVLEVVCVD
jgi:hypothetical protein